MHSRSEEEQLLWTHTRPIQNALVLYQVVGSCSMMSCGRQNPRTNSRAKELTYPQTDIVPQ